MSRLIAALLASALVLPAAAQAQIVPDTAAARTTNTQTGANGPVTFIGGGQLRGGNLFHSFSFFNVGQGQAAVWVGPQQGGAAVANVINRVTGGSQSIIQGELASIGLPNANFYLLNPAGVFFGPGAVVNLPNAVHFSAAQELRFADGARFSAVTPNGSTFTSAAPQAFGFLGGQGNVTVGGLGAAQFVPQGARLHLSGGNVGIFDSGFATRGLDMIAVGSGSAAVSLADPLQTMATGQALFGNSGVTILSGGGRPGLLRVSAGLVEIDGGFVVIQSAPGLIGSAQINSGIVSLVGGAELGTVSAGAAGGPIAINAGQLLVAQQSRIFSETYGASPGGAILIGAADLLVGGFGKIESATMTGSSGGGGAISIAADRIQLVNGVVTSLARASGNAGAMIVQARTIDLVGGGISSATFAGGNAGAVSVTASDALTVAGFGGIESVVTQTATGNGGMITVQAGRISLANNAFIDGSSTGAGRGGEIRITAGALDMTGGAHVSAASTGSGAAGTILLDVGDLALASSDINTASVAGTGAAGTIRVRGNRLALTADSAIQSASVGGGAGGSIDIAVGDVLVDGSNIQSFTLGAARAGDIVIVADTLAVTNGAAVTSFSAGAGDAGAVRLAADSVTIASGSTVATSSAGTGAGGAIDIEGDRIRIDSAIVQAGSGFSVQTLPDGSIRLIPGAANAGPGGAIRISGGDVALANRGIVTTDTFGGGRAGDISFIADSLGLDNQSGITASTSGTGRAGLIRLVVDTLDISGGSGVLSITNAGGDAGGIIVDAADRVSLDRGIISSNASPGSTGASGSVTIEAPLVALRDGSGLLTDSDNVRAAGIILVRADDLLIDGRSSIASTNQSGNGGAAGAIRIEAERVSLIEGGQVLTDSATGAAGDIEILMPSAGVLRLESRGAVTGISTSSGPGTGGRITIASPYLILSNGGVILALGEQGGANVRISSDFFIRSSDRINLVSVDGSLVLDSQIGDPSTGTEAQDVSFLDASSVLRGQCAGIRSGGTSAFTSRVTGPYAPLAPAPVEDGGGGSPTAAATTAGSCS